VALAIHNPDAPLAERIRDGREEFSNLRSEAGEIASGIGQVARDEARLAVAEVRQGVRATVRTGISGSIALAFALVTLLWLPLPIVVGLAEVMPWWAASLVTVGILALVTAIIGMIAYGHLKSISLVPRGAIDRFKEDKEWLTQQLSRGPS
jgi:uncharacterized membrane protein YqjE